MWKKIIVILLILIIAGAGGYGTYHFYKVNKDTTGTLTQTQAQLTSAQGELAQLGTLGNVYSLARDVMSGDSIKEEDLVPVYVPLAAVGPTCFNTDTTSMEELSTHHYRSNYSSGVLLTSDMLMTEEEAISGLVAYSIELTFDALPVTLVPGDYVDLRMLIANGEEYVVLDHKPVQMINNTTVQINISEEENAILNALYNDLATYRTTCVAYLYKYLNPGEKQTLSFYPVQSEMEDFLRFNPNITDPTRCINHNLRAHINEQLLIYSDSANIGVSENVILFVGTRLTGQQEMRNTWVADNERAAQEAAELAEQQAAEQAAQEAAEAEAEEEEVDLEEIK